MSPLDGAPRPAVVDPRATWRPCGAATRKGTACRQLTPDGRPCYRHRPGRENPLRVWTPALRRRCEALLEDGLTDREAAAVLGVTVGALSAARSRLGFAHRDDLLLTASDAARMIGCSARAVHVWAARGWIHGQRHTGRGPSANWFFREADVMAFMEDPNHWHRWEPALIADARLRVWATRVRGGVRFLSTSEVARRLCCSEATVGTWIRQGRLPAARSQAWMVREEDLARFTLPEIGQGSRKRSWLPCARCGDLDGPIGRRGRTPERRKGAPWGIEGRICRRCYRRLLSAERRRRKRAA